MSIEARVVSAGTVAEGDIVHYEGVPIGIALEPIGEGEVGRVLVHGMSLPPSESRINIEIDDSALDEAYTRMAQAAGDHTHALWATGTGYNDNVYVTDGRVVGVDWARTSGKERFPDDVVEKAWKLLEDYMSPDQYFAFMEKSTIEIENDATTFRLLINKVGNFTILEGKTGAGIVASSGRIRSYEYPLGDEIATFIDHFRYKTKELIGKWNCGTYGIVKDGQRR